MKAIFKLLFKILGLAILSWSVTIGFVYLIALCFKISFTILIGTGVWLCLLLFNISTDIKNKK